MSMNISHPLDTVKYVEKPLVRRGDAHFIQILLKIEKDVDEHQSKLYHFLDTLQWVEEKWGSFRMCSDNNHLSRIEDQWYSFNYNMFTEEPYNILTTLQRFVQASHSFNVFLQGFHFSKESRPLDTLQRIEEKDLLFSAKYLPIVSHLSETLQRMEDECNSFYTLLVEYLFAQELDTLSVLQHIEEYWGPFRMYLEEFRSKVSDFLETSEEHMSLLDRLRFLKRDFKFLSIIIELHIFEDEPHVSWGKVRALFHGAGDELIQMYSTQVSPWSQQFYDYFCHLQYEFQQTKLEIIKANFPVPKISCQVLANEDGIVIPGFVMKFIDIVTDNISNLLKFDDPSSPLCIGGRSMVQKEMVLKDLNFLSSFVCFVSDRCIETQVQHALFTHAVQVAWQTTMTTWLYLPSNEYMCQETAPNEEDPLLSDLLQSKIQPIQPSICKFYIHILQALNLVQSQWYPVINVKYVFDCEVGFLESLRHTLKELPVSSNCIAIKAELQETLNFFRAILVNLPTQVLEYHLQEIDSAIVDAGLLVFSLNDDNENLDFRGKIQSMQGVIYLVARKKFLLQFNLPGIDRVGSADFILDNREKFLSMYSNSVDSVKSQLPIIQKELKFFQAVVEQQDGLQHFATKTTRLVYEVEHMVDACKKKDVPDWCIFIWILNIGEDIRMLMAEVAEIHNEILSSPNKLTSFVQLVLKGFVWIFGVASLQFASTRRINEEIIGFEDVKDELIGKLKGGSSRLDVIAIVGMAGLGKTTLANKLYSDKSVVSYFDIHAHCCVSQEYTRKDLLLAILHDITDERAKLRRETENELADKLRKLLMRKRYLLLIDDVWETSAWDDLKLCFPEDNNGSRIILTTRHYGVASHAKHDSDPHKLRFLNSDESWMLLNKKVFNNESGPLILRDVSQEIVRKCGGLPISIILVAGILTRMKKEKHCWEQMATNLGTNIQDQMEGTLDLSYQNLPPYLKPCFLYLGVFPEDGEIQVSKLTWLWIAEGFIKPHTGKTLEEIAENYLENLVGRNLVMIDKRSSDGRIKTCRIHDLVHEVCRKKAKLENILQRINGDAGSDPTQFFPPKCNTSRHLSLHSQCDDLAKWCLCFSNLKSFQFRESRRTTFSSIHHTSNILKRFKFLRVLDFEFTVIDSFPQELILLRYVSFRTDNDTLSLPANLWNLETLIVQGTRGRISLPETIWKMVKLRHLQINDQAFFTMQNEQEFLVSSSKMDDLQTLSSAYFSCAENADKILAKTPNIRRLTCEVSAFDGSFTAFINLTMLEILKISSGAALTSVDQLKLPSHLKKLTLSNFCIHLDEVTTLSNLKVLKLLGVTISSNTWKVNDEQFSKLKFLKLENLSFSEWDVSDDAFPCLEHLLLKRCRYLEVIPSCFGYMSSLKSIEVKSCKESLADSAMVIKEMQVEDMGFSDFEVIIHRNDQQCSNTRSRITYQVCC
ncbi:putative late blight resistance protein homolog R1B-23 isoform X1 [Solanum verrucosum]|uniref:putative late blight resistance protein homolog R1B-23 isoform X1 n=1 Tax=Solanum verrucosum TaxID=315347 RepID=UPI0020D06B7C|nr:putative late blight resistance protein homolog R1B-23 isoform X1 [Solanum verrucosum]